MNGSNNNSARLPMLEAVMSVAIFAIVSVILLSLYMSADRLSGEAVAVSRAMIVAENAAEQFAHDGSFRECINYDRSFSETEDNGKYQMTTVISEEKGNGRILKKAVISVRDTAADKVLCELNSAFISE